MVEKSGKDVPIDFMPSDMPGLYATNIVVQHTSKEFVITFWEVKAPPILGTTEERKEKIERVEQVLAHCVARMVVSPGRMKGFVGAMQENWETYQAKFSATEDNDGE
jgi:hypothetical protein